MDAAAGLESADETEEVRRDRLEDLFSSGSGAGSDGEGSEQKHKDRFEDLLASWEGGAESKKTHKDRLDSIFAYGAGAGDAFTRAMNYEPVMYKLIKEIDAR